jgi:hypothetical protein
MRRLAFVVALGVWSVGCSDSNEPPPPVTAVEVQPPNPTVAIGGTVQLNAVTRSGTTVLTGRAVSWSSNPQSVAMVSSTGLVTGITDGTATITATSEGVNGTTTVTVDPVPVASLTIYPDSASAATLVAGDSLDLTDTTRAANGAVLTGRTVTYSSMNGAVATVTPQGRIRAQSAGTTRIIASAEGKADTANITVVVPYVLFEVNNQALPTTQFGLTFSGGRAVLYSNGRYNVRTQFIGSAPNVDTGTYTVAGTSITMTPDDALLGAGSGSVTPTALTVSFGTAPNVVTFAFTR